MAWGGKLQLIDGLRKVCAFSFRSDGKRKEKKAEPRPSWLPARSLRNVVQAKASVGQEGNYRPYMGDTSAESSQGCFWPVFVCIHVHLCGCVFKACVSFLLIYLILRPFYVNNVETLL